MKNLSRVGVRNLLLDYHIKACQIPDIWHDMIRQIIDQNLRAIEVSLGNLELAYRRTLQHHEELKKREAYNASDKQKNAQDKKA